MLKNVLETAEMLKMNNWGLQHMKNTCFNISAFSGIFSKKHSKLQKC